MSTSKLETRLRVVVLAVAALHLPLIFSNINWDEFRFLADVHLFQSGALSSSVQTFHVHMFRWLPGIGSDEIGEIFAARGVYYVLLLGSCFFVYIIARTFMSAAAATFVVLCCLSYSEVIRHGTSFRYDGLAIFLLLGSLAVLLRYPSVRWPIVPAAVLVATALLVTVKSIFLFPTLGMVLLLRRGLSDAPMAGSHTGAPVRDAAVDLFAFAFISLAGLTALFLLHRHSLDTAALNDAGATLQNAGRRVIQLNRFMPASHYLRGSIVVNLIVWLLLMDGFVLAVRQVFERRGGSAALLLLSLTVPLLSLTFYRNAFPYFYVFMMPTPLVLCGLRFDRLSTDRKNPYRPALLVAAVLISFANHAWRRHGEGVEVQRQVLTAVHEIFREPQPYIDRNSMVASFPKVGFFMSTWGFQAYYERGVPIFEEILRKEAPRFVLANHPALVLANHISMPAVDARDRLLEEDMRVLKDNFVPHWGPIFVAGKRAAVGPEAPVEVEILIPGFYTVEAPAPVQLSNVSVDPGSIVRLARGHYTIESPHRQQVVVLRWGDHLPVPRRPVPTGVLYSPLSN